MVCVKENFSSTLNFEKSYFSLHNDIIIYVSYTVNVISSYLNNAQ